MAKLPANLVKRSMFDNPLRPTAVPQLSVAPARAADPIQDSIESENAPIGETESELEIHRVSVRFTDSQWKALQTACHARRMTGAHTNVAEMLRELVDEWRKSA